MPFPTAQRHGKVDQYQTYALCMAGTKRKLIATVDDSGPTGNDSSAPAPSKKICHDHDRYNPKYMAHMCFGAHMQRVHAAGMASYPWHVEEDYRQDLTCMFAHAHSKGSFRQDTAARHMIPRLAGIALRSKKDKIATVKEFIKHYDTVQEDLLLIQDILSSDCQADLGFVNSIRNCVASLHLTLLGSPRWRTIIPYTPLPKACLPMLRNVVADPKHSHFLSDLSDHISDMESWLNRPPTFVEVPTRLTSSIIDKLQQQTERSSGKAEASPLVQSSASTALVATTEEQQTKRINQLEERIAQISLLAEQRMGQINLLKEQLERTMAEKARLTDRVKTLELAAAEQAAKHKLKEKTWITAAELEKEHLNQIIEQKSEIDRLNAALSAEQKRRAVIEAQGNSEIDRLNTALSTERERSAFAEANAARLVAQATDRNVPISVPDGSNLITNDSFPGIPSSSHAISSMLTGDHANSQPHALQQLAPPAIHQDVPIAMEVVDDCNSDDSEMDIDSLRKTSFSSVSRPNLFMTGQVKRIQENMTNGMAPQPDPGQDKVFKEACRDFKLGRCRRGKKCRFPHQACRRWLSGTCNHGDNCNRSHDPFFLEKSDLQSLPNQSLFVDKFATNNALQTGSISMVPERQGYDTQPSIQTGWAQMNAPQTPKPLFTRSRTQHGRPDTPNPFAHVSGLQNGGSLVNPLAAQPDLSQGLNQSVRQKKQACRNYLSNVCNEGHDCKYAHSSCSFFMKGTCRFTDETCKKSHDPLFIMQGGDRSQYASSQQENQTEIQPNLQHLDDLIRLASRARKSDEPPSVVQGGVSNDGSQYASPSQKKQPEIQPSLQHLDNLIRVASKSQNNKLGKSGPVSISDTPCRWQKTPAGCTNSRCGYKHDPPKATVWLN